MLHMKPFETTPVRKPRLLNQPNSFPFLLTIAVAASLFTFLFAQATLRVSETDVKVQTTLTLPSAISTRKQPRQEAVTYLKKSFFDDETVPYAHNP